ncbi:S8 family serine peptidase [Mesobacillus subterraneus]|uniref:S8 family serine peptidase n=1 Tax=Mesobacillus subterraneus TaxID=285983 RepID=UPI00203F0359|nr:S8 family serine peptidase [Mesobacillus subterraneus]MCM3663536.1 S8 family serine peptidase [Mesobacillus subterraneus]MCM3683303.1 S8 family serine peptidase [Mesobacillus subterraneus]
MKLKAAFLSFILMAATVFASLVPGTTTKAIEPVKAVVDAELTKSLLTAIGPVEAIVTFKSEEGVLPEQLNLLKNLGITKGVSLNSLPIAGILATRSQIDKLAQSDQVLSIYLNKKLAYENAEATDITGVDQVRTDETMRKLNGGLPVTGKGIGVVINDSGVDGTHKDLEFGSHLVQNVLGATNLHAIDALLPITYVENVPNTDTSSGHGTHVAGIVGGTGAMSGGKYEGVAPGANLIGYGSGAAVAMLDTIGGFDYALTHQQQYNIRVITNSWGDTSDAGTDFDPYNPINIATKRLYDRGIVTVFSAGNSGPDAKTISGNYKKAPWVVTVAAGDKSGKLADFSSRGEEGRGGTVTVDGQSWKWADQPTITSPGVDIISTRVISPLVALGATADVEYIEPAYLPYYTTMSGTSMAAPHVAGIIALMLEANPLLSPSQVKSVLENTATAMPDYAVWEVGAGYVNAYKAVDASFKMKK